MTNANLDLWKEMRKSTLSREAARGECTRSVIGKYGRENEEKSAVKFLFQSLLINMKHLLQLHWLPLAVNITDRVKFLLACSTPPLLP